jgi:hypothetical protein
MLHESYVLRFRMSKVIIAGEAQDDRETFVFTGRTLFLPPKPTGETGVQLASFLESEKEITVSRL